MGPSVADTTRIAPSICGGQTRGMSTQRENREVTVEWQTPPELRRAAHLQRANQETQVHMQRSRCVLITLTASHSARLHSQARRLAGCTKNGLLTCAAPVIMFFT